MWAARILVSCSARDGTGCVHDGPYLRVGVWWASGGSLRHRRSDGGRVGGRLDWARIGCGWTGAGLVQGWIVGAGRRLVLYGLVLCNARQRPSHPAGAGRRSLW